MSEVLLWQEIRGKSLGYEFHRQVPIDEFIVDFFCHELRLAIEVDGESHDFKYDYDVSRQSKLEELGVRIIRFGDSEVKQDINNVIRGLLITIEEIEKNIK